MKPRTLAGRLAICAVALVLAACSSSPTPSGSPSSAPSGGATATPTASPTSTAVPVLQGAPNAEVTSRLLIAENLSVPWDMAWTPDGTMYVTMRDEARIWQLKDNVASFLTGPGADWLKANVYTTGEAGLLGIAISPNNPNLFYLYATTDSGNVVLRATRFGDILGKPTVILDGIQKNTYHDAGRIRFGPDGYLYVPTGDAGNKSLPQDLSSLNGKILRIVADGTDSDGTAAPGNPFGTRVWTYGHRNVEGLGWTADGRMFASELGQNIEDELNLIEPGKNYGWPIMEAMIGAPAGTAPGETVGGFTYPLAWWPTTEASPSGITITDEANYMAALTGQRIWRIPLTPTGIGTPTVLLNDLGRVRLVQLGPDGYLYVLTSNTDGRGTPVANDDRIVRLVVRQLPG